MVPVMKSSVALTDIKKIQKGSGKYELCLNLICAHRDITLQIEDGELRKLVLSGLIALVDRLKRAGTVNNKSDRQLDSRTSSASSSKRK